MISDTVSGYHSVVSVLGRESSSHIGTVLVVCEHSMGAQLQPRPFTEVYSLFDIGGARYGGSTM